MYCSWIFTFVLYLNMISGEPADYSWASRCKSIPHDVIHATENACYTGHFTMASWGDAVKTCEDYGGRLAILPQWVEFEIAKYFYDREQEFSAKILWIGAREVEYGSYVWLNGGKLETNTAFLQSGNTKFRGWLGAEKKCLAVVLENSKSSMQPYDCKETHAYICEQDIATDGPNPDFTTLPNLETRVGLPSPTPDQHDTTGDVDSVTTSTHDNKFWTTTPTSPNTQPLSQRKEIEKTVQQGEGTQRFLTMKLLDIDKVEELPVPRVWMNVTYLNQCAFRCHADDPPYNIMGYNIRTKQCMCYKTGDDTVTLDDNDRDGAIYYTLQTMVY